MSGSRGFASILLLSVFVISINANVLSRNLIQFSSMISHKGYNSLDYNNYGCWCGSGTYGSKVLDATDDCCRIHDQCYDRISGGFFGCSPKLVTYDWEGRLNHAVVCTDPLNTCDRNACECDKAAVDCFQRNRATFDIRRKGAGNQYICNP